ncbi:MAG TPA: endolytic transglycosylase MltG [Candidatus Binatia bacterium]
MKTLRILLIATVLGAAVLAGVLFYHVFVAIPVDGVNPAQIRVEQGDSLAAVVRKLRDQKIISNAFLFSLWARLSGAEKRIHQGLYRFETGAPPREILDRLVTGKGIFQTVTIPEGLTVKEIAALLEKVQIADKERFLAEAANPSLLSTLGLHEKGLEGYLFPSTYHFTPATPEKDIIVTMAEQFRKVSLPLLNHRDGANPLTSHEILTLASIIEKETGIDAERPLVSAVFHNRLKRQMPLQSDPTVIYGVEDFNGNLTRKHLNDPTPYNTYRIAALPPGPICNPSLSSIRAALQPAQVSYLYFVSRNDGTHLFSDTLEAHNQAVKTYQPVRDPSSSRGKAPARR